MKFLKSNAKMLIPFKVAVNNHTIILTAKLCLKSGYSERLNFCILKVLGCSAHNFESDFALMLGVPSFEHASEGALPYQNQIFISIDLLDAGVDVPVGVNSRQLLLRLRRGRSRASTIGVLHVNVLMIMAAKQPMPDAKLLSE